MRLADFDVLSFDCYGTLIDWEAGLLGALEPLLALCPGTPDPESVLERFAACETVEQEATPAAPYPQILTRVHRRLASELGVVPAPEELHETFGASVAQWPAFPDSAAALARLARRYRLVILSNVDRASFRGSNERLGVEFSAVYTAQDIGSYKPARRNFDYLVEQVRTDLGVEPDRLLHVAQSLYHDHVPAIEKGLATAWIDRRAGRSGWGATAEPSEVPSVTFRFVDLAGLADAAGS